MLNTLKKWLLNRTIGERLRLGFGLLLVLFTLYGAFAVHRISLLDQLINEIYDHPATVSNAVRDAEIGMLKIHRAMKDIVECPLEDMAQLQRQIDEFEALVFDSMQIIDARYLGDHRVVSEARQVFLDWRPIRNRVIQMRLAGDQEAAELITREEGAVHVNSVEARMQELKEFALGKAAEFRRQGDSLVTATRWETGLMLLLALGLGLAVAWAITASIVAPVKELAHGAHQLAEGDLSARVSIQSRDELGELAATFNRMAGSIQDKTRTIEKKNQENERLLLAILPRPVALRLKEGHGTIADSFSEVSVLFADLVGFTPLSQSMTPEALVDLLDQLFSSFDQLALELGVEKIKTIGDAYMACCGLPTPCPDHADTIVRLGLEMLEAAQRFAQQTQTRLNLRIGINTGPVVAGVIGRSKFIYDLWGDTVNTASRMESHGVPGTLQITQATYQALSDPSIFRSRGIIEIKGKGKMEVYISKTEALGAAT